MSPSSLRPIITLPQKLLYLPTFKFSTPLLQLRSLGAQTEGGDYEAAKGVELPTPDHILQPGTFGAAWP